MKLRCVAVAAAALALCAPANAAYLDFVAEGNADERGVADGTEITFGDVVATFTSLSAGTFFAYFDADFQNRPAGLGVCETLVGMAPSECADPGDDNIRADEAVTVFLDDAVASGQSYTVSGLSFTDADHFDLNSNDSNTLLIAINSTDDGDFVRFTFAEAVAMVFSDVTSIRFAFDNLQGGNGRQFYVNGFSAEVPLPAAAPLLLMGLGGLGFAARRKKSAA